MVRRPNDSIANSGMILQLGYIVTSGNTHFIYVKYLLENKVFTSKKR